MIFDKIEAGRGGDLAPAPEDVSADTPGYSPALSTKQENRPNERSELIDRSAVRLLFSHATTMIYGFLFCCGQQDPRATCPHLNRWAGNCLLRGMRAGHERSVCRSRVGSRVR